FRRMPTSQPRRPRRQPRPPGPRPPRGRRPWTSTATPYRKAPSLAWAPSASATARASAAVALPPTARRSPPAAATAPPRSGTRRPPWRATWPDAKEGDGILVWQVAFAPDGKTLAACCSGSNAIVLWDPATGRPAKKLKGHDGTEEILPNGIDSLDWSHDGKVL